MDWLIHATFCIWVSRLTRWDKQFTCWFNIGYEGLGSYSYSMLRFGFWEIHLNIGFPSLNIHQLILHRWRSIMLIIHTSPKGREILLSDLVIRNHLMEETISIVTSLTDDVPELINNYVPHMEVVDDITRHLIGVWVVDKNAYNVIAELMGEKQDRIFFGEK